MTYQHYLDECEFIHNPDGTLDLLTPLGMKYKNLKFRVSEDRLRYDVTSFEVTVLKDINFEG